MMPLLSIAMPSLNQREFIEAAIRSALDQPVDGVELAISDGGSTDGTVELLTSLSAEYGERLRWISGQGWLAPPWALPIRRDQRACSQSANSVTVRMGA
jgi:glycosyltransferase involved in cell wall biosynthesis